MRQRQGFTLVELLAVIGIIALLTSLLMPAVLTARRRSISAACQSNLHDIGQALQVYRSAHELFIPSALVTDGRLLINAERGLADWLVSPAFADAPPGGPGADFTAYCHPSVLACPGTRGTAELSYGVNGRLIRLGKKFYFRSDPSDTPVIFDARFAHGYYYSDLAFRHIGDANVLFADYHVAPRYVDVVQRFSFTEPLPGAIGKVDSFSLKGGVVLANTDLKFSTTVLGGTYDGGRTLSLYYRVGGGKAYLITRDAMAHTGDYGNQGHGNNEDGVDSSNPGEGSGGPNGEDDPSGDVDDEVKIWDRDTITLIVKEQGHSPIESDDGSDRALAMRRGEILPDHLLRQGIPDLLNGYVAADGTITIPENSVIYFFNLSASGTSAGFCDLVLLVTFAGTVKMTE